MLIQITPGKPSILRDEPAAPVVKKPEAIDLYAKLSREGEFANYVVDEHETLKAGRTGLELKWLRFRRHILGEYGPDFVPDKNRSDLFIRRTRERVGTAHSKLLKIIQPSQGSPWDLQKSSVPRMLTDIDPVLAAAGMRQQIRDRFQAMKWDQITREASKDLVDYGTGIVKGPVGVKPKAPIWVRIAGKKAFNAVDPKTRPEYSHCSIWDIYIDPMTKKQDLSDCSVVHERHVLNKRQLRELGDMDGFDPSQIELLIQAFPNGNFMPEHWESAIQPLQPKDARWIVIERHGLVEEPVQKRWGIEEPEKGYLTSWSCGPFVLFMGIDDFHVDRVPYHFAPYEARNSSPYGIGPAEHMEDIQTMLNALGRSLHNNLADSSQPQIEADMTMLGPDEKCDYYAGKVWQVRPNELSQNRKAVNMTLIPNNSPQIVGAWKLFEDMVPISTSMPVIDSGQQMGSGIRSMGQQEAIYENADTFIKGVVGNWDEYLIVPTVLGLYAWEMAYGERDEIKGDLEPVAMGVRGAVRREIVARNAQLLRQMLADPEGSLYLNNPRVYTLIVEGLGLDDEGVVLTQEELAAKMAAMAQREALGAGMKKQAEEAATHGIRAAMSRADAFLAAYKGVTETNPAWGPMLQQVMEAQGGMTPALYAGLNIWAQMLQADLTAKAGPGAQAAMQQMAQSFRPQKELDMDPDYRGQPDAGAPPIEPEGIVQATPQPSGELPPQELGPGASELEGAATAPEEPPPPPPRKKVVKKTGTAKRHSDGTIEFTTTEEHGNGE